MDLRASLAHIALAVCAIAWPASRALAQSSAALATVEGRVYDSLAHAPLAGAAVSLVSSASSTIGYSTTSDSAGRYTIRDVAPGTYLAGFFHPLLDSIGIQSPVRQVTVGSDARKPTRVDLGVPGARQIRDAICGASAKQDSTGIFVGHVEDASTDTTLSNAKVTAQWSVFGMNDGRLTRSLPTLSVTTSAEGWFAFCGLPSETRISVVAAAGDDSSGIVTIEVPARSAVHHDFLVTASVHRGPANLRGVVLDGTSRKPLPGVQLSVLGTGVTTTANDQGEFALGELPLGTQTLAARKVGYAPAERIVDLLPRAGPRVELVLSTVEKVLDTVRVTATRVYSRDDNGFYRRQRIGIGHYFDANQIARIRPFETSDLLYRVAGVRITSSGFDRTVFMRAGAMGSCIPSVFIDGNLMMDFTLRDLDMAAWPDQVQGMEVYTSPIGVPPELMPPGGAGCGVIAVWTKPALPRPPKP